MKSFINSYLQTLQKENKLILKGTSNKILNCIFSKKLDYLEKKILSSRLPPLYSLEISHVYASHISQRRNSIRYLHNINKVVLKNKLKTENVVENNSNIINDFSHAKDVFVKKSFFELAKIREITNIWDYSHDYCERIVAFYASRFVIMKGNDVKNSLQVDSVSQQKIFDGHRNKIGAFAVHPKSKAFY